jgi:hypothetical protein
MAEGSTTAAPGDAYASQKANIRDTVKWMAAAYAGIAAVFIAGAPFSGLGSLPQNRLIIAALTGAATLIFIFLALGQILKVLIGDNCFARELDAEIKKLIDEHAEDILPARFATYDTFLDERKKARQEVRRLWDCLHPAPKCSLLTCEQKIKLEADFKEALAMSDELEVSTSHIIGIAHLFILQRTLSRLRKRLSSLTILGIGTLVVCIWALTPTKPESKIAPEQKQHTTYLT